MCAALGHAASAFGSLSRAAIVGERGDTRLFLDAFQERGVLSVAPHSEPKVEFMARAASSWYVRRQELIHRFFEQACRGVSSVHGFDVVCPPPAHGVFELFGWPKHGLRCELVHTIFKVLRQVSFGAIRRERIVIAEQVVWYL